MIDATVVLCFSGGKDSVLALQALQSTPQYHVVALLTTVTSEYERVRMHGVRRALLHRQVTALGLPLLEVAVPAGSSNDVYERQMGQTLTQCTAALARTRTPHRSVRPHVRVPALAGHGGAGAYVHRRGVHVVVCVDPRVLDPAFAGRAFDETFLADLPTGVDPCGENGEFHTSVWNGPIFRHPIPVSTGTVVERDGCVYADLVPQAAADRRRHVPKQE